MEAYSHDVGVKDGRVTYLKLPPNLLAELHMRLEFSIDFSRLAGLHPLSRSKVEIV